MSTSVENNLKHKTISGVFWAFFERFGLQLLGLGVTTVLSRLLSPNDYGTLALLSIFTCIVGNLVDSGFGQALIQKKDATDLDFNSVFWFSVAASILGYAALFIIAPFVARFYGIHELCPILRVVSVALVFSAINSVQRAVLVRKMQFNLSFRISLLSALTSAIIGIVMAFNGYGPWALVWQGVAGGLVSVVAYWVLIGWRPKLMFDFNSLKCLFGFGWKVTASFFMDQLFGNIYGVLIGKFYTRADLAFVEKGRTLPGSAMMAISGSLERVCYPVLTQLQDDHDKFKAVLRKMIKTSTFLVFPLMIGLAACSDAVVPLLFGDKWRPAIPFMQLVCLQFALRPFHSVNLRAILALGKSDVFFKLEVIKKIVGLVVLVSSLPFGVFQFMLASTLVSDPLCVVINAWPNRKLIGYTISQQVRDVLPSAVLSLIMGVAVYMLKWLPISAWAIVFMQVVSGCVLYFTLSILTRSSAYFEFVDAISSRFPAFSILRGRR